MSIILLNDIIVAAAAAEPDSVSTLAASMRMWGSWGGGEGAGGGLSDVHVSADWTLWSR